MPPAGYMWPGGPPLPEWIQVGATIQSSSTNPNYRGPNVSAIGKVTAITEAYVHYRVGHQIFLARPEHFVNDWSPPPSRKPVSELPRFWPEGRPSTEDINRHIIGVCSPHCKPGERAVISEVLPGSIYFYFPYRRGKPTYAETRQDFIRRFRPRTPFANVPEKGLGPGETGATWHRHILDDDPF